MRWQTPCDRPNLRKIPFSIICMISICPILSTGSAGANDNANDNEEHYEHAVWDAALPSAEEIRTDLIAIEMNNKKLSWNEDGSLIKVVTWMSRYNYENYIEPHDQTSDDEKYVIWVTVAPYIQEFCRHYLKKHPWTTADQLDLRLKQRLGLSPDWTYDVFVELWVSPLDIFRPCVDPEITDTTCNLNFGDTMPVVKNIRDYGNFYKNLYFNDFRESPGIPWTGLGYTYDWSKKRGGIRFVEHGESEFILSPGTPYRIEQAVPTLDYCQPGP